MYLQMLKGKIHRATVIQAELNYVGSITIDEDLLDAAGILEYEKVQIVDTARINLREQINSALHRGAKAALKSDLQISNRPVVNADLSMDSTTFSHEDSVMMIQGGFFDAPPAPKPAEPAPEPAPAKGKKSKKTPVAP